MSTRRPILLALSAALLAACSRPAERPPEPRAPAAPPDDIHDDNHMEARPRALPNLALPTLGGRQVWADVAWRQGWRVQENVLTGHFRLLDPGDVRRAWGDEPACRAALERTARELDLGPRSPRLAVLVHGLFRSRHSLAELEDALVAAGWDVAALGYPSSRRSIEDNAATLARLVAEQDGYDEVSFVTHSLGGLVARVLLAPDAPWPATPRAGRLVMLAPPNRGAALARAMAGVPGGALLFALAAGPAGTAVASGEALALPVPRVPFGIVAGGRGDGEGWNPLLEGDDDGVVRVAETELEGAADFALVPGVHTFLMRRDDVARATVRFLETGRFAP